MPDITLDFSNKKVNAYLIENNAMQRTETITVEGNSEHFLSIKLQDGVTLVNETKGTSHTKNANLYGGDKFYLKAPLTVNGSWTSEKITNCKYRFQPIVYRTESDVYQDVTSEELTAVVDKGTTTSLTVNWLNTGNLIIHKVDVENKNIVIPDTVFDIYDSKNNLVSTVKTDKSGAAKVNNLVTGTYKILEKSTNKFYKLNTKEVEVKVDKGNTDITITNQEKKGYIEIDKYDKEQYEKRNQKIGLSGVKFGIFDIEGNKIQEIVTDVNRICKKFSTNFEKAICC